MANDYWPEHFGIDIRTSEPAPNVDNCELLLEMYTEGSAYRNYEVAIPSKYDGQKVYILIRHYDSSDNFYMYLDDLAVTNGPTLSVSPAPKPQSGPKFFSAAGKYRLPEMKKGRRSVGRQIPFQSKELTRR